MRKNSHRALNKESKLPHTLVYRNMIWFIGLLLNIGELNGAKHCVGMNGKARKESCLCVL